MSEGIMAIATVVMAIFAGLSWRVSRQLKKDGAMRDADVRFLFMKLVAGIMASGKTAGEPVLGAQLFVQHEEALLKAIENAKEPLPSQGG